MNSATATLRLELYQQGTAPSASAAARSLAHGVNFDLANFQFAADSVGKSVKDIEAIAHVLRQHPESALALVAKAQAGDMAGAIAAAAHMGLSEEAFRKAEGELIGLIIIAIILILVFAGTAK